LATSKHCASGCFHWQLTTALLRCRSLHAAIAGVLGEAKPFSISGSLPLVRDLQRAGLDLTMTGFGKSSVYHCDNEFCLLSDMKAGFRVLAHTIANVEAAAMA
jgi:acetylornithine deacetylase